MEEEPMVHWTNTFNMRQVTLCSLSGTTLRSMVQRTLNPRIRSRCVMSATKSLDILRQNLQASINRDIDSIIKGYLEKYFAPAVYNIRHNLGQTSVTEEHIREVCRSILEEAKLFYSASRLVRSRGSSPQDSEATETKYNPRSPLFYTLTRKRDHEEHSLSEGRDIHPHVGDQDLAPAKRYKIDSGLSPHTRSSTKNGGLSSNNGTSLDMGSSLSSSQGNQGRPFHNGTSPNTGPPLDKLDPLRIELGTQFMLGSRALKVLGVRSVVQLPGELLQPWF
uniref:Deoxynucleotidyltransferase terminal-interacting protein 1 n=1 Tax=Cacopsylla melanoneura TaxID=428564 RepID=A0A8D9DUT2_9HEMI